MHDFNCSNADDMYFKLMAERTRYLKETKKGVNEMSCVMEEICEKVIVKRNIDIAKNMLLDELFTFEQIAKYANLFVEKVEKLQYELDENN